MVHRKDLRVDKGRNPLSEFSCMFHPMSFNICNCHWCLCPGVIELGVQIQVQNTYHSHEPSTKSDIKLQVLRFCHKHHMSLWECLSVSPGLKCLVWHGLQNQWNIVRLLTEKSWEDCGCLTQNRCRRVSQDFCGKVTKIVSLYFWVHRMGATIPKDATTDGVSSSHWCSPLLPWQPSVVPLPLPSLSHGWIKCCCHSHHHCQCPWKQLWHGDHCQHAKASSWFPPPLCFLPPQPRWVFWACHRKAQAETDPEDHQIVWPGGRVHQLHQL